MSHDDAASGWAGATGLRRRVAVAGAVHVGVCLAWIATAAPRTVWLWLVGATAVAAYFAAFTWRHAPANRPKGTDAISSRLGWGTRVTLLRISCLSLLTGYVLSPPTASQLWHVAGLYAAVGAGDWLDGFLARRTRYETPLGELLDVRVDIAGVLVASVVAVTVGRLPVWYLTLGAAYFILRAALAVRRALGRSTYEERLTPSAHARTFAGFQMTLIAAALAPVLDARVVQVVATCFMLPSLALFVRDWCVATGRLVPGTAGYQRHVELLVVGARDVIPALLRPVFGVAAIVMTPVPTSLGALWITCASAVLAGFAPRVCVLPLLAMVAFAPSGGLSELALVVAGSNILLLGSGSFSLYQPEERWFFDRHGGEDVAGRQPIDCGQRSAL